MFNHLSIKQRMFFIVGLFLLLFVCIVLFAVNGSYNVRDLALSDTSKVMLDDQKAKLKVATHSIALAIGQLIESLNNEQDRINTIRLAIDNIRFEKDKSGYYFVYQGTTNIALPPKKELQGKDLGTLKDKNGVYLVKDLRDKALSGGGFVQYIWPKPGAGDVPKLSYAEMIPGTNFWIGTGVYLDNIDAFTAVMKEGIAGKVNSMTVRIIGIAGVLFVTIAALCLFIVFGITKSLDKMISGVQDIAEGEGDLTKRIEIHSNDELGELAGWLNLFMDKLQTMIMNMFGASQTISESASIVKNLNTKISGKLEHIADSFGIVSDSCVQTSDNMISVSAAMEQATTNVDTVAAAAEEMSSSVEEIAKNTASARQTTDKTVELAQTISTEVNQLGNAANEIDQVTTTITDISEQTNLLALNATIEAARAGEAGKGFAVVANEIKTLAQQTAEATLEIRAKIESVQQATSTTIERIVEVTQVIEDSSNVVNSIASAVEEQSAATREIAENASQTAVGIQEVNENVAEATVQLDKINKEINTERKSIEDVAFSTVEADINSNEMSAQSQSLADLANMFHTGDKKFNIGKIKIAHLAWRTTLEAVIRGVKQMKPEDVTSHKECDLGKWYFGPGQAFASYKEFQEINVWHEKVHTIARDVVELCAKGEADKSGPFLDDFKEARENLFKLLDSIYLH